MAKFKAVCAPVYIRNPYLLALIVLTAVNVMSVNNDKAGVLTVRLKRFASHIDT